jgi:hypothetical protein
MKATVLFFLLTVAFVINACLFPKNNTETVKNRTETVPYAGDDSTDRRTFRSEETDLDFVDCDFTNIEPEYAGLITNISKSYIKQIIKDYYDVESDSHCYYDKKTELYLSCYKMETKASWIADFNNDGEKDILFRFIDEGCGGGGNCYGFEYIIAMIKNKKLQKTYSLFGGGKLSYAQLEIDTIMKNKIFATFTENPYANLDMPDKSDLRKVGLSFKYEDGRIVEESYKNCQVANMDKRIFKENPRYHIERSIELNDMFEEESNEKMFLDDSAYYLASFSGCENINLSFSKTIPNDDELGSNKSLIKKVLAENISFLIENTRYESTLTELLNELKQIKNYEISIESNKQVNIEIQLGKSWFCKLSIIKSNKQYSWISINLLKKDFGKELGFWENFKKRNCSVSRGKD